jgi:UDP-glucose 4-epimerase
MRKKCIIYGGAGFIGSHIADILVNHNFSVTIFDKKYCSRKNIEHLADKITFIEGDFTNKIDIETSIKDHDYIIHLVSSTIPSDSNLNPFYDVESNLIPSIHLLNCCLNSKVSRVIFISSGGTVYGNPLSLPVSENHPTNPITSYGIIKLAIEKYLGLYNTLYGLDYRILRFANPFGERQNPKISQGLIAHLLYKIKNNNAIEIWGDGKTVRDFFYIKDGVRAVYLSMIDKSPCKIYNIGMGKGYSINQILNKFRKVLGLNFHVKYHAPRKFDVRKNILDITLAGKYLKWKPETDFNTALINTWRHILENE